jgi:hypothetical protein
LFYTIRDVRGQEYIQEARIYGSFLLRRKHGKLITSARLTLRRNLGGEKGICYFNGLFFAQAVDSFFYKILNFKYLRKPAVDEIRNLFSQI